MSALTRRDFVAGSAGAAALAVAGASVAMADEAASAVSDGEVSAASSSQYLTAETVEGKWAFQVPPEPISDDQIANTVENDVIVIGAGTSGLVTAAHLLEQGVGVTVIASSNGPVGRGGSIFAMGSKYMDEMGVSIDVPHAFKKILGYHSCMVDERKWWLHANRSPEAMNWLIDLMTSGSSYGGNDLTVVLENHYEDPEDIISEYWGTHDFIGGPNAPTSTRENPQQDVVNNLYAYCQSLGGDMDHFFVTAQQLVREDGGTGRVDAVIAEEEDGSYTKYVGKKAIVLATGDFGTNKDMIHAYCPQWIWDIDGGVYDGKGHQMALWVGAGWQKSKVCAPMLFSFQFNRITNATKAFTGLLLNKEGERFESEDNVFANGALAYLSQTDHEAYAIWDTAYAANYDFGYDYYGGPSMAGENGEKMIAHWDSLVESSGELISMNGASLSVDIWKCDTIEEAAEKAGLPVDKVVEQVERYNGFCETGVDEDFGKYSGHLHPVSTAPYYICRCTPWLLIIAGGLRTDLQMHILDENNEVIPGLYGVGTIVGDMYQNCYSTFFPGHNLGGNCLTFGYVAAEAIANEE